MGLSSNHFNHFRGVVRCARHSVSRAQECGGEKWHSSGSQRILTLPHPIWHLTKCGEFGIKGCTGRSRANAWMALDEALHCIVYMVKGGVKGP